MFDPWHAAKVLVREFPEEAIGLIAEERDTNNVERLIKRACQVKGLDFGSVMSIGDGAIPSQSPPRSNHLVNYATNSNHRHPSLHANPMSPLSPPPSSPASSLAHNFPLNKPRSSSDSSEYIYALTDDHPPEEKLLKAIYVLGCYNLIRQDIALDRLQLIPKPLPNSRPIRYKDAHFIVSQYVSLTWKRESPKTHETVFFLVSMFEGDLIFGSLNSSDLLSQSHNGLFPRSLYI